MKYNLLFFLMLFSLPSFSQAIVDRIVLKDGSILEGYIENQEEKLHFKSFCSVLYADKNDIKEVKNEKTYQEGKIEDKAWKEYIIKNKLDSSIITLSDITVIEKPQSKLLSPNMSFKKVQVLESGDFYKLKTIEITDFSFKLSEIQQIERVNSESQNYKDIIETCEGDIFKGHVLCSVPGQFIKLREKDGRIINIFSKNIKKESKEFDDDTSAFLENIPYLDVIVTNDKEETSYSGVICESGSETGKSYFMIKTENNRDKKIYVSNIKQIKKEKNSKYIETKNVIGKSSQITINGEPSTSLKMFELKGLDSKTKKVKESICYCLDRTNDENWVTQTNKRCKVKVTLPTGVSKDNIYLFECMYGVRQSPKDDSFIIYESFNKDVNIFWFKSKNLKKYSISCEENSDNPNVLNYDLNPLNMYILYNEKDKSCILIKTN